MQDSVVPTVSQQLYNKLKDQYDKESQVMLDDTTSKLSAIVPFKFLSKIPQQLHDKLYISLGRVQCEPNTARHIAMSFLKLHKDADADFIEWYSKQLQ
jgi:hypothetical protein